MSKAVLISINPKWCSLISQGKKTVEVRKTRPKLETPFKCYIYCTKFSKGWVRPDNNVQLDTKIIGEFVCDGIISHCEMANADIAEQQGCIRRKKLLEYSNGKELYGWHISDLVIYDKPKELSEFHKPCIYAKLGECIGRQCDKALFTRAGLFDNCENILLKPPQSWCYVEEREENE